MKTYIAAILVSVVTASCAAQAFAANQEPHSVSEKAEYTHNKIENAKEAGVLGGKEAHKMQKEVNRIDKKAANLKDHDKLDRQQYQRLSNELRHENKKLSKIERKSRMN